MNKKQKERVKLIKKDFKEEIKFCKSDLVVPEEVIQFMATISRENARIFGNVVFNVWQGLPY